MADGSISIAITVDGKDVDTSIKGLEGLGKQSQQATGSIKTMVASFGLIKVASAAFGVLKDSMGAAIDRFDTFKKFPKVMEALGFSAEESKGSMDKLSNGIEGLPTKLSDVVAQTQQLTSITGDLDGSTDTVLALNNAFLASGASAEDASRGMVQYNQMLSKGQVDMQSWRSLQETMPLGLQKTAEAMGFVGKTAQQDLYKALQQGDKTFDEFNNQLVKLGTGTGQLATLARTNSEGIATSFTNLKNAAVKGLANVLEALNNVSKQATGATIAKNLDSLKGAVNGTFKLMVSAITASAPAVKLLTTVLGALIGVASNSIPLIAGVGAAFVSWKVAQSVNSLIATSSTLLNAASKSSQGLSIALKSAATAQELSSNATKVDIALRQAQNGQITIGTALISLLSGGMTASTFATTLMTAATTAFRIALNLLLGPVGLVIAGVTALVAVFMAHNKRQKEAKEAAEKETKAYTDLNKSIAENQAERAKSIKNAGAEKVVNDNLISSLADLYSKSKASKAEKKDMANTVDQLNKKYSDLNLVYNQETGYLNQSIDLVRQKVKAYEAQSKLSAYNEAINANLKEQIQLETQEKAIKSELAELEKSKNSTNLEGITGITAKIKEYQQTLTETHAQEKKNADEYRILQQDKAAAVREMAAAEQAAQAAVIESLENSALTYDELTKTQQKTFDAMKEQHQALADSATNAFEKIDTSSKISLGKMVENMAFNTEATRQWGDNQASLIAWAGQNGYQQFIPYIESMGVDQAGVLAEMTKGLDANNVEQSNLLTQLAINYQTGYSAAGEAGKKALSTGLSGVSDEVYKAVIQPLPGLNAQVAGSFSGMGKGAADNVQASITQSTPSVKSASEAMAAATKEGFQLPLEITGSSSGVFERSGEAIVQGTKSGIESNKSLVTNAAGIVAKDAIGSFDNTPAEAESVGRYAMRGLANGIDNNAGTAISAAQRVAQQVTSTMQKALEIHSPSRVMRDKVGRFIPEGVAVGIDKYAGKAYTAIGNLSSGLLKPIVPEFAAGAYDIGSIGSFGNITNNYTQQSQNSERPINLYLDRKMFGVARNNDDISRIMQEMENETIRESRGGFGYT